jgi:hypothetical protein
VYSIFPGKNKVSDNPSSCFALLLPVDSLPDSLPEKIREIKNSIDYPENLYDIFILTDNIPSSEIEKKITENKNELLIIEYCNSWRKGKEFAVEWALARLMKQKYNAFLIIDETVLPEPRLLKSVDAYISEGSEAVQVSVSRSKKKMTWQEHLNCISAAGFYHLRPKARKNLGISCGIQGTGFCMTKKLLKDLPFQPFEYKNWFEYHIKLVCSNKKVAFIQKTGMTSGITTSGSDAEFLNTSRKGSLRKQYIEPLFKAVKRKNISAVDCLISLFLPSMNTTAKILFSGLFSGAMLLTAANIIPECYFLEIHAEIVIILSVLGLAVMIFYYFVAVIEKKLSLITCLAGFFFPVYILYFIIRKFLALCRRT